MKGTMNRKYPHGTLKMDIARIFKDKRSDPYINTKKLPDPTICPDCGAVFTNGRWSWKQYKNVSNQHLCPACQRTQEVNPAGVIELEGEFFEVHKKDIMCLIRNVEEQEVQEHPLERIMQIHEENGKTIITTTGIHLPGMIGKSIKHAHEGKLDINYNSETITRVQWVR